MLRLLCRLLLVNLRISDLISRATPYFVQSNTTITLNYLATLDELRVAMPDAGDSILAPNRKLKGTECFILFTFYNQV